MSDEPEDSWTVPPLPDAEPSADERQVESPLWQGEEPGAPVGHARAYARPAEGCLRCGVALVSRGVESFRVGGTTGKTKFFLGEWGELGEGMIDFEVLVCPKCRRVELRV